MTGERVNMYIEYVDPVTNMEYNGWVNIANNAAFARCADEEGMQCVHYHIEGTALTGQRKNFILIRPFTMFIFS